jgi:hypothetical protein
VRGRISRPLTVSRTFAFRFRERTLHVTTGDAWASELLSSTYEPLLCAQTCATERAHIPQCDGFSGAFYAVRDLFARFAACEPDSLALYGAAVAWNGAGVLILGPTGVGKSVLALNAAYGGAHFLGDETALLDMRSGALSALPRTASLRERGLPYLLDVSAAAAIASCRRAYRTAKGRFWYALDDAVLNLRRAFDSYPLHAVLCVEGRAAEPFIEAIPLSRLLPIVAARVHRESATVSDIAALYARLQGVRGFRVSLGSSGATLEGIARILDRAAD